MIALAVLGSARVTLRVAGFQTAVRLFSTRRALCDGDWDWMCSWARAVESAAGRMPGTTCLPKAMALHWILARRGYGSEIRIGVSRDNFLAAHAWVECGGRVILGGVPDSFAPIASIRRGRVS